MIRTTGLEAASVLTLPASAAIQLGTRLELFVDDFLIERLDGTAEMQDLEGKPIPGSALAEAAELIGDDIERVVNWKSGAALSKLDGRPIKLRFVMKDADVYSLRFRE